MFKVLLYSRLGISTACISHLFCNTGRHNTIMESPEARKKAAELHKLAMEAAGEREEEEHEQEENEGDIDDNGANSDEDESDDGEEERCVFINLLFDVTCLDTCLSIPAYCLFVPLQRGCRY